MIERPPEEKAFELQLEYAWNWFSYHAGQRLTGFNFFLILAAATIVGYSNAVREGSSELGIGVGSVATLGALAFLIIDLRNKGLIGAGVEALRTLEAHMDIQIAKESKRLWLNHSTALRGLLVSFAVLGVIAAYWAAYDFGDERVTSGLRAGAAD